MRIGIHHDASGTRVVIDEVPEDVIESYTHTVTTSDGDVDNVTVWMYFKVPIARGPLGRIVQFFRRGHRPTSTPPPGGTSTTSDSGGANNEPPTSSDGDFREV